MEAIVTKGTASIPEPPSSPAEWESEQEPGEAQSSPVRVGDGPIQVVWSNADQMFNVILACCNTDRMPRYKGDLELINHSAGSITSEAYQKRWKDYPRLGSIVGYVTMTSIAAGIKKAGSTDTEKLIAAFRGLKLDSPFGPFEYRVSDQQATMGAYVGKIENGRFDLRVKTLHKIAHALKINLAGLLKGID